MAKNYFEIQESVYSKNNRINFSNSLIRNNGIPLDLSSIYNSFEEAVIYAAQSPIAYEGQPISVTENGNSTLYVITPTSQGTISINENTFENYLKEVGSIPSIDNKSISQTNGILKLFGYGEKYYLYNPEEGEQGTENYKEAYYSLQIVDEDHPWKSGLEPRVVEENGKLVIGWFEPNPTTLDGINNQINNLQVNVNNLSQTIGTPESEDNPATGFYLKLLQLQQQIDNKIDSNSVYTKEQTDEKISIAIANADHLKRKIVDSIDDIDINNDQYIYLVPNNESTDSNLYDEYLVINKKIEKVGKWSTDLSDYVTNDQLQQELNNKVDIQEGFGLISNSDLEKLRGIEVNAQKNFISSVDVGKFTVQEGELLLNQLQVKDIFNLEETLNNKVDSVEGSRLINQKEIAKLNSLEINDNNQTIFNGVINVANVQNLYEQVVDIVTGTGTGIFDGEEKNKLSIENGAQVNIIDNVNLNEFKILENKTLTLKEIPVEKITGLISSDDFKLNEETNTLQLAKSYITDQIYGKEVGNLSNLIHMTGNENSTIIDELNYVNERLKWQDLN